jgi:hypothetical protein
VRSCWSEADWVLMHYGEGVLASHQSEEVGPVGTLNRNNSGIRRLLRGSGPAGGSGRGSRSFNVAVPAAPGIQPPTTKQVIMQLAQRGPMAIMSIVHTAETHPENLLGGPGGYSSKASFPDRRISTVRDTAPFGKDVSLGSMHLGGDEVFPTGAQERITFIRSVANGCRW